MIAILGDSHTIALKDAYDALPPVQQDRLAGQYGKLAIGQLNYAGAFLKEFHVKQSSEITFIDPKTTEFLGKMINKKSAVIARNCKRKYVFSLGFHPSGSMLPKRWVNHSREIDAGSRQYVSKRAFNTFVREYNMNIIAFYRDLQDLNIDFSVVSCCPLPIGYYTGEVQDVFAKSEMGKWHLDFRHAFASELDGLGIKYHSPPDNIYTNDGLYMRQEFSSDRKVGEYHANPKYGKIMLDKIISEIKNGS